MSAAAMPRDADEVPRFAIGPLAMAIEAAALRRFVAEAPIRAELIYASGPVAPRTAESFVLAGELGRAGRLVLFTRPRGDGRGTDWWARKPAPGPGTAREAAAPAPALHPEAEAVYAELARAATLHWVCPTDAELARRCGLKDAEAARYRRGQLIAAGMVSFQGDGKLERRIATIAATGQATVPGPIVRRRG